MVILGEGEKVSVKGCAGNLAKRNWEGGPYEGENKNKNLLCNLGLRAVGNVVLGADKKVLCLVLQGLFWTSLPARSRQPFQPLLHLLLLQGHPCISLAEATAMRNTTDSW